MLVTMEGLEAPRFHSHGGGNRNAPFHTYQQTPARKAAASNAVPFVGLPIAAAFFRRRNYGDLASLVDFNARNTHTRRSHGPDRSGHVLLAECGWRACHGLPRTLLIGHCCERAAHRQYPGFDFLNQVLPSVSTQARKHISSVGAAFDLRTDPRTFCRGKDRHCVASV